MRKEFPVNRWLRKHMTPLRTTGLVIAYLAFIVMAPHWFSVSAIAYGATIMMMVWAVISITTMIWWVTWEIKNRYQPEFCKECGRVLPEKFEN